MNIAVPTANPMAASSGTIKPAMPAPSSALTAPALKSATKQDLFAAPAQKAPIPAVRAQLPTDAEKVAQQLDRVVEQLNQQMQANHRNLSFGIDRKINTVVITVTDKASGEVVRQIPPESVVRVAHHIENLKGLLFSARA